jgi:hypothetical protein
LGDAACVESSDNLDAGTFSGDSVLFLSQKIKEKKQFGLLRKRTLASSCSMNLEWNNKYSRTNSKDKKKWHAKLLTVTLICLRYPTNINVYNSNYEGKMDPFTSHAF